MIEISNIHKSYGEIAAVRGVSFSVNTGEILGLLGPNGAGKTTILKILCGLHYPDTGSARVASFDVVDGGLDIKRRLGYLPENAPLYGELTVLEFLRFAAEARFVPRGRRLSLCDAAIEACGLSDVVHRPISMLSRGYRQRTGLAQAIVHDPDILILDEPTSGLDPNQVLEIRRLIRSIGERKTVVLSTHVLQEVEALCDRVLILNDGRVAASGTTEQISAEFSGAERWSVALIAPKRADASIFDNLPRFAGTDAVQVTAENNRARVSAEVSFAATGSGPAVGELLFDWAVAHGFKLIQATPLHHSLEELFVRLTGAKSDGGIS